MTQLPAVIHSPSGASSPGPLTASKLLSLFHECGNLAAEDYLGEHPELSINEKAIVFWLTYIFRGSMATIELYAQAGAQFFNHFEGPFNQVQARNIKYWVEHLKKEQKSPNTITCYLASLKSFYSTMSDHRYFEGNPARIVIARISKEHDFSKKKSSRARNKLPKFIPLLQATAWLKHLKEHAPFRDYLCVAILWACGLRRKELCDLVWGNLFTYVTGSGTIRHFFEVKGKGDAIRNVYVPTWLFEIMMQYRELVWNVPAAHEAAGLDDMPLLTGLIGDRTAHIGPSTINKLISKHSTHLGIKNVTPHWLRHSHATTLRMKGKSLPEIQEVLGHEDPRTTQIYAKFDYMENPPGEVYEDLDPDK